MIEAPTELADSQEAKQARPYCQATTKAGKPCRSTALVDGKHCLFHAPEGLDPAELGRKGGQSSAVARRAHAESGSASGRDGRQRLRQEFETDQAMYDKLKATYEDAMEAVTMCPGCKERGLPDHRVRIAAGDSLLAQIYGKPQTNIQTKTDVTINVVSRLGAALERAAGADVDLPADDVRELEAG